MQTQIPESLKEEMLRSAAHHLRDYAGFEYRRFVEWSPQALHIREARGSVNYHLNKEFMTRLREESLRDESQSHPFKKLLSTIVDEAAAQIEFPRTADKNFPNNFAYVPKSG